MSAHETGTQPLETLLIRTAQDALDGTGLLVDHVQLTPAGRRRVVTVVVDRDLTDLADGDHTSRVPGVDLDAVAAATRLVSDAYDVAEPLGDRPYTLEVTTPGVSRPLTKPRHYRRNVGRLVEVTPLEGPPVRGRIVSADDEAVTIRVEAAPVKGRPARVTGEEPRLSYADLSRAKIEVEFVSDGSLAADEPDEPGEPEEHGDPDRSDSQED